MTRTIYTWGVALKNNFLLINRINRMSVVNSSEEVFEQDLDRKTIYDRLVLHSKRQLDRELVGVIDRLDWHFYRKMNKSFIEALINNPSEAVMYLMEFYSVESSKDMDGLKYVIYVCLKIFFLHNNQYSERAFNLLINGEYSEFHKLVREFIDKLKNQTSSTSSH